MSRSAYLHDNRRMLEVASGTNRAASDVRSSVTNGSIASLRPSADHFRSSPGSGHRHSPLAFKVQMGIASACRGF
jgi:hypothetical protein